MKSPHFNSFLPLWPTLSGHRPRSSARIPSYGPALWPKGPAFHRFSAQFTRFSPLFAHFYRQFLKKMAKNARKKVNFATFWAKNRIFSHISAKKERKNQTFREKTKHFSEKMKHFICSCSRSRKKWNISFTKNERFLWKNETFISPKKKDIFTPFTEKVQHFYLFYIHPKSEYFLEKVKHSFTFIFHLKSEYFFIACGFDYILKVNVRYS